MIGVYLSSSTNSTIFTKCCGVAICDDEAYCPQCREEVIPGKNSTRSEKSEYRWKMAYGKEKNATWRRFE